MIKTVCSGGWLWNIEQFGVLLVSSVPSFYFQFECQCTWMVFRCFSTALHSFSISFAMWHSLVAQPKLHSGFFPPLCPTFLFLSVLVYVVSHGVFCLTLRSPLVFFRLTGLPADCRMAVRILLPWKLACCKIKLQFQFLKLELTKGFSWVTRTFEKVSSL